MKKCNFCGNYISDIVSQTNISGNIDDSVYTWAKNFKIFMRKYVPEGELWLIEFKQNRIHKIINHENKEKD